MKYQKNYKKRYGKKLSKPQSKQVREIIKSELGTEMKTIVYEQPIIAISTSATISPITTTVLQGTQANERIGNQVKLIDYRMNLEVVASTQNLVVSADTYNHVRFLLFRWYNSTTPSAGNVFTTYNNVPLLYAQYNEENIANGLLHIVYDRTFELYNTPVYNGGSVASYNGVQSSNGFMNKRFKLKKLGRHLVHYQDILIPSILGSDHLYYLCVSDSNGSPNPSMLFSSTLRYIDV